MDGNIRILYTIMAKSEEINKKFQEAQDIHRKMYVSYGVLSLCLN